MSELLPDDIMHNILSRLPVKSILRFRCVCKPWLNLFRSPNFVKNHYKHGVEKEKFNLMLTSCGSIYSSLDYIDPSLTCYEISDIDYPFKKKVTPRHDVFIWQACNGLLCIFYGYYDERICVWNPSTREYKVIPLPESVSSIIRYGFGYDSNIEDYKLIRISNFHNNNNCSRCEIKIYTLGSNSWKNIPVIYPYTICGRAVTVNGILHWIGISDGLGSEVIVSFDLGVERFVEMPIPEHFDNKEVGLFVAALGGCLCIFDPENIEEDVLVVWVMKRYGVRESWAKLFTICQQSLLRPLGCEPIHSFTIGDQFLIFIEFDDPNNDKVRENALVLCEPKNERVRALEIRGGGWSDVNSNRFDAMTYVESLVSLNTGTCVGSKMSTKTAMKVGKLTMRRKKKNKKRVM